MLMLYVPTAALEGILTTAVIVSGKPVNAMGFAGVSVHCVPESAVASQVALAEPV